MPCCGKKPLKIEPKEAGDSLGVQIKKARERRLRTPTKGTPSKKLLEAAHADRSVRKKSGKLPPGP